jgi:hypothetical protein
MEFKKFSVVDILLAQMFQDSMGYASLARVQMEQDLLEREKESFSQYLYEVKRDVLELRKEQLTKK